MPTWLTIVIAIFGLLSTLFGIFGISAYINERLKHKAKKQNDKEDAEEAKKLEEQRKLEEMRHAEYITELKVIIGEALIPIAKELTDIKSDLGLVKGGVQVTCRTDLEELADKADKQGFLSAYDKDRFEVTYQKYHALGQNGVMDAKRDRALALPESKPVVRKPKTKRVLLVENK